MFGQQELIALTSAIAVFAAVLAILMPMFATNKLSTRMKQVAEERERLRARERAKLAAKKGGSLRSDPKRLAKQLVERFDMLKDDEDGKIRLQLKQAGYRGEGPVYTYLATRVVLPLVLLVVSAVYVFGLLKLDQPFTVKLLIVVGAATLGYYIPAAILKNMIEKRQLSIKRAWPDSLDLMLICVESGMSIEAAFRKVSEEIGTQSIELAEELSLTTAELSYLQDRRVAYENLSRRTNLEGVKSVVTALVQAEKYGTPLGQALRVLAQENRDMRMSEAEKKAAALPPKLTVPMIVFFLPVLFAVIIGPAIIQIIRQFS